MERSEAQRAIEEENRLKQGRSQWESHWGLLARTMRSEREEIDGHNRTEGNRRRRYQYDSTVLGAIDNFVGGLYGMTINPAMRWFAFGGADPELVRYHDEREWLDHAGRIAFASLGPSFSKFELTAQEHLYDLAVFNTSFFLSELKPQDGGFRDVCIPLSEAVHDVTADGETDRVYRRYGLTARQIVDRFGGDGTVPDTIRSDAEKNIDTPREIIHGIYPNPDYKRGRLGPDGKAVRSLYVIADDSKSVLRKAGYHEFPVQVNRWKVASGEIYGRGPGMDALTDVLALNAMEKTNLTAGERAANPPLLAPREGAISVVRSIPNGVTYGGVSPQGRQLVVPLNSGINVPITLEMADRKREQIRDRFMFSLMQLVGRTGMTATEVTERAEEKYRLLGPYIARLQVEWLTPFIERRFQMLLRAGAFPPPPPRIANQPIKVTYEGPLAKAQRSANGVAILRLFDLVRAHAEIDQTVMDRWDSDKALAHVADAYAAPPDVLRSDDEVRALREQRAQAEQAQAALEAAERGAGALAQIGRAAGPGGGGR